VTDVAVIGCGDHGTTVLLPALHAAGARIVGLHDADEGRAAAAARRWGTPKLLGSIDEAIDAGEAIVCALPGPAHYDIVDRALTRGRFVFVEKPPAVTLHEVEALIATERCSTARCAVGLNFRFSAGVQELLRIASSGVYGRPVHVRVSQFARRPQHTLWGEPVLTHSLFFAQGIHVVDLAHLLIGEAEVSTAAQLPVAGGAAISATLRGTADVVAEVIFGSCASQLGHRIDVVMSSGTILALADLCELTLLPGENGGRHDTSSCGCGTIWRRSPLAAGYHHAGYEGELAAFLARVAGDGDAAIPTLQDAARAFRTFNAMLDCAGEPAL
jgi:predicted dehydrogenase